MLAPHTRLPIPHPSFFKALIIGLCCAAASLGAEVNEDPAPVDSAEPPSTELSFDTDQPENAGPRSGEYEDLRNRLENLEKSLNEVPATGIEEDINLTDILNELNLIQGNLARPLPALDLTSIEDSLTAISSRLDNLQDQVSRLPATTAPAAPKPEAQPDTDTDKIFILVILLLVLVAVLIFLNLFPVRRASGGGRAAGGPSRKDFQELRDEVRQAAEHARKNSGKSQPAPTAAPTANKALERLASEVAALREDAHAWEEPLSAQAGRLEQLGRQLEDQQPLLQAAADSIARLEKQRGDDAAARERLEAAEARNRELESTVKELQSRAEASRSEDTAQAARLQSEVQLLRDLWPDWVRALDVGQDWDQAIPEMVAKDREPYATRFLGAALHLESQFRQSRPGRRETARALAEAGEAAYAFLIHGLNRPTDQVRKAMRNWTERLQQQLQAGQHGLRISQIYPGDAFQMSTMEAVDTISGNRLHVDQVLSWLVEDISESSPRVLHHAKVITS